MLFTFRRDEEGRETIHVGDVHVASIKRNVAGGEYCHYTSYVPGADFESISDAIKRAGAAGFWSGRRDPNEVTVNVPIAETSTTLTLVRDGEDDA